MSYTVLNADAFRGQVKNFLAKTEKKVEVKLTGLMKGAQSYATMMSPVYSGDFASNWNVSVGAPDASFSSSGGDYMRLDDKLRGQPLTTSVGVTKGNFSMAGFKLGLDVYLSNASAHDEPYAWKIELGQINFRPVNRGKHAVRAKTLAHIRILMGGV